MAKIFLKYVDYQDKEFLLNNKIIKSQFKKRTDDFLFFKIIKDTLFVLDAIKNYNKLTTK